MMQPWFGSRIVFGNTCHAVPAAAHCLRRDHRPVEAVGRSPVRGASPGSTGRRTSPSGTSAVRSCSATRHAALVLEGLHVVGDVLRRRRRSSGARRSPLDVLVRRVLAELLEVGVGDRALRRFEDRLAALLRAEAGVAGELAERGGRRPRPPVELLQRGDVVVALVPAGELRVRARARGTPRGTRRARSSSCTAAMTLFIHR